MKVYTIMNNGVIPMIYGVHEWDSEGKPVREVVLKNSLALQHGISKMILNTNRFTAIDKSGKEHHVINFQEQKTLIINGIPSGQHFISSSISTLPPGTYSKLKFYLKPEGGSFIYADRTKSDFRNIEFIEFDIEDGLKIVGNEALGSVLRFDLAAFQSLNIFKRLDRFFRKTGVNRKLQSSFGS